MLWSGPCCCRSRCREKAGARGRCRRRRLRLGPVFAIVHYTISANSALVVFFDFSLVWCSDFFEPVWCSAEAFCTNSEIVIVNFEKYPFKI